MPNRETVVCLVPGCQKRFINIKEFKKHCSKHGGPSSRVPYTYQRKSNLRSNVVFAASGKPFLKKRRDSRIFKRSTKLKVKVSSSVSSGFNKDRLYQAVVPGFRLPDSVEEKTGEEFYADANGNIVVGGKVIPCYSPDYDMRVKQAGVKGVGECKGIALPRKFEGQESLTRILTYLAEGVFTKLSYVKELEKKKTDENIYKGLCEVQIGWIPELRCMLVTENNLKKFKAALPRGDILAAAVEMSMSKPGGSAHGKAAFYYTRIQRHYLKLMQLIDQEPRYGRACREDPEVANLMDFIREPKDVFELNACKEFRLADCMNKIVVYDPLMAPKGSTNRHAELYHLSIFSQMEQAMRRKGLANQLRIYISGTKRPCFTCAAAIEVYKRRYPGRVIAFTDRPGNFWFKQSRFIEREGRLCVEEYIKTRRSLCETAILNGDELYFISGLGSESDSFETGGPRDDYRNLARGRSGRGPAFRVDRFIEEFEAERAQARMRAVERFL